MVTQDDRRERSACPVRLRMARRNLVCEQDCAGGQRKGDPQEEEGVRAEKTPQMPETRHGRTIGGDCRNSGRFRYESRMNDGRIPESRDRIGQPGGSR